MSDMTKVIKELEEISDYFFDIYRKEKNGYSPAQEYCNAAEDAIALLKGQEAVRPRRDANCVSVFRCGACGKYVGFIDTDPDGPIERNNYCRYCGRAVKW